MASCIASREARKSCKKNIYFLNLENMEKLIKGYDLSTLDVNNLTLDMIPNFTEAMESRRKELYNKSLAADGSFTQEFREEYATLQFIKTADDYRDAVLADWVISEDEKPIVTRALQAMARAKKLEAGIDSY